MYQMTSRFNKQQRVFYIFVRITTTELFRYVFFTEVVSAGVLSDIYSTS